MKTHIELLGLIDIVSGVLCGLIGLALFAFFFVLAPITGDPTGAFVLMAIAVFVGGVLLLPAIPTLIAGIGLLQHKPWARILALIVGVFAFFNFPLGTVIALYTFWVLMDSEAAKILGSDTQSPPEPLIATLQTS